MPNGQAHLMVNLAEDEFTTYGGRGERISKHSGAVIAGPHAKSVVIDTRAQRWLAAVQFRHGGASRFFSTAMTEIANHVVQLQHVWHCGGIVRERLLDAPTAMAKFRALEEVLLEHLKLEFDPSVQYATIALRAGASVSQVAWHLGLSPRTLERRFSAQVGVSPKRFARVQRLQRVLRAARGATRPDWCALAAEHGYADQAHLIHDFRDLADITPLEYKPHSRQRNNHVPIVVG